MQGGAKFAVFDIEEHSDNITITALINGSGGWRKESWNDVKEKKVCLEDEEISMIVLIIANSDLGSEAGINYSLKLEEECPLVSHGYIRIQEKTDSPLGGTSIVMRSEEVLEYNKEDDVYDIVERIVTCEKSSVVEQPAMYGAPAYRVEENGTGSLSETYYDMEDRPWRIYIKEGREASLNIGPETRDRGWVKSTIKTTGSPARTENTTCVGVWPSDYTLTPDQITEDGIKGSDILDQAHLGGVGTLQIDFEYWYK
jgi:hypothetical protein